MLAYFAAILCSLAVVWVVVEQAGSKARLSRQVAIWIFILRALQCSGAKLSFAALIHNYYNRGAEGKEFFIYTKVMHRALLALPPAHGGERLQKSLQNRF